MIIPSFSNNGIKQYIYKYHDNPLGHKLICHKKRTYLPRGMSRFKSEKFFRLSSTAYCSELSECDPDSQPPVPCYLRGGKMDLLY
jgi:hypothetical protein